MGALSVTGKGYGSAHKALKPPSIAMSSIANGPNICIADYAESGTSDGSAPSHGNIVVFSQPLPGNAFNYVISLTTINGGHAYVTDLDENSNGDFVGFTFITEAECVVMYTVIKVGRKNIIDTQEDKNCKRRDHDHNHNKYDRKHNDKMREQKNKIKKRR